ncbi:sodium:calcium antiporter [Helicobacter pylori]|uniref:type IV secretion system outer membrane cap subunit Cag3 n=1 Tax=Helicobacter pylori TaxID=210 RepID=UPI0036F43C3D
MFRKLATAVSLIGLLTSNTLYAKEISEADKVIKATKETKETKKEAKRLKKEAKQHQQIPDHKKPQYASVDDTKTQALFDIYDTLNVNDKSFGDWFGNSALKDKTYLYAMDLLDYNNYLSIENPIIKTRAMGTYADLIIITGSLEQVNGYYNILKALNKRNAKFVLKINENMPYAQATFLRVPKRSDPNAHTLDKGASIDENKLFEQQKRAYFNYANDVICRPNDEVCSPLRDEMVAIPTSDSVTQKPNIIAPYSLYRLKETNNANEAQPSPYATQTAPENSKEKLIEELIANSQLIANEEEMEKKLLAEKEKQEAELAKYKLKDLENQKKLKALEAELKKKNAKKPRVVEVPISPKTGNSFETMRVVKEKENYNGLLVDKETTIKRSYEGTLISENSYSKKSPINPNDLKSLEEEIKSYYIKSNGLCYANGISLYVKIKNDPYKEGMLCGYESVQTLLLPLKDKLKYDKQKLQKALLKDSK